MKTKYKRLCIDFLCCNEYLVTDEEKKLATGAIVLAFKWVEEQDKRLRMQRERRKERGVLTE